MSGESELKTRVVGSSETDSEVSALSVQTTTHQKDFPIGCPSDQNCCHIFVIMMRGTNGLLIISTAGTHGLLQEFETRVRCFGSEELHRLESLIKLSVGLEVQVHVCTECF